MMEFPGSAEMLAIVKSLAAYPEAFDTTDMCALCGATSLTFDDALSIKEFTISRMCQTCQDGVFGK